MKSSRPSGRRLLGVVVGLLLVAVCGACSATTVASPAATPSTTITSPNRPSRRERSTPTSTAAEQPHHRDRAGPRRQRHPGVRRRRGRCRAPRSRPLVGRGLLPPGRAAGRGAASRPRDPASSRRVRLRHHGTCARGADGPVSRPPLRQPGVRRERDRGGDDREGQAEVPDAAQLTTQAGMPVRLVISEPPEPAENRCARTTSSGRPILRV